jgi:S1-C subfamily serine protease
MTVLPDPPFERHEPLEPALDESASRRAGVPRGARGRLRGRLATFVAGLVVMLALVLVIGALGGGPAPLSREEVARAIDDALASQTPAPPRAQLVYAAVSPSIIAIETEGTDRKGLATSGSGTGVLVNDRGEVLTALHVVEGATKLTLRFADGTVGTGSVTSEDPANDIAVVTADSVPQGIPPATLGNPGSMRIGSDAYIVGNPFGLYASLSAGVVSGLDRAFRNPDTDAVQNGLIQVDAAVNPGNSGGPLLDGGGRVVGIVTALVNPTDERVFIGIGLAVPIDVAGGGAGLPPF